MKIQVLSDLHIEGASMDSIEAMGDVLVLAGDIHAYPERLPEFIERKIPTNIPVIFVPGNHDHEYLNVYKATEYFETLLKEFPNVTVLQNKEVMIDGVQFIGSTLWTDFSSEGWYRTKELKDWASNMPDFRRIESHNGHITVDEMAELSRQAQSYIGQKLQDSTTHKRVVVTHYAPLLKSRSTRYGFKNVGYWCNELPHLMGRADLWIHGHVHDSSDYIEQNTRVVCNPRGHCKVFNFSENPKFDPRFVVEI